MVTNEGLVPLRKGYYARPRNGAVSVFGGNIKGGNGEVEPRFRIGQENGKSILIISQFYAFVQKFYRADSGHLAVARQKAFYPTIKDIAYKKYH